MNALSFRMSVPRNVGGNGVFSTWLTTNLVNHAFVATRSYTPAAALYVGLFTTAPTPDGGGIEVSPSVSYARQSITFNPAAGSPPVAENAAEVDWPVALYDWGIIVAAGRSITTRRARWSARSRKATSDECAQGSVALHHLRLGG